ncbi:helix-turn-helix domain-containing protein [Brucella sp. HL-2]|nr:helix-turn-helix domain-containing protein [Brucella sp. HL-2]MCV9910251.1 helix-turn-helix domain-containing protein [Brucella sp. HL-2]
MFRSFYEEAGNLSYLEGNKVGEALVELLASAVKFAATNFSAAPAEHLRMQILNCISENIQNPKLNVEYIFERFGISRSHLYRLLEEDGGAAATIRQKRLQLAYRDLALRRGIDRVRIKEIAYRYGFLNADQFSSSFKKHFSVAPTDVLNRHNDAQSISGQITKVQRHFERFSIA